MAGSRSIARVLPGGEWMGRGWYQIVFVFLSDIYVIALNKDLRND
jgi:hypothetical protein